MASNDISKQLQINFISDNLRPQSTEQGLIDVADRSQRDSTYQTALKKSLDVENRRSETRRSEDRRSENRRSEDRRPESASRSTEPSETTAPRAEDSRARSRHSDQDARPEPTRSARPEPERNSRLDDASAEETTSERSLPVTNGETERQVDAASPTSGASSNNAAGNHGSVDAIVGQETGTQAEVAIAGVETQVETPDAFNESLAAINTLVAQLFDTASTNGSPSRPPASFSKDVLNKIGGAETISAAALAQPLFETNAYGKLSAPGKLLLGLIAKQVGPKTSGTGNAAPIDPEAMTTAIKEAVSEFIAPAGTRGDAAPTDEMTESAKQELLHQIAASFGKQKDENGNTEAASETNAAPVNPAGLTDVSVEPVVVALDSTLESQVLQSGNSSDDNATKSANTQGSAPVNSSVEASPDVNAAPPTAIAPSTSTNRLETQTETTGQPEPEDTSGKAASSESQVVTSDVPLPTPTSGAEATPAEVNATVPVSVPENPRRDQREAIRTETGKTTNEQPVSEALRPRPVVPGKQNLATPAAPVAEVTINSKSTDPVTSTKAEGSTTVNGIEPAGTRPVVNDRGTARPSATLTTLPAADSAEFLERLTDSVRVADKNHQQLKVRLTPPQLGSMHIEVTRQDGVVTARMEVQSVAAQQLLLDQMSGLKETLQQQGHHIERIEVVVQEPGRSDQSNQQQSQQNDEGETRQQQQSRQERQRQQEEQLQSRDAEEQENGTRQPVRAGWSMDNIDVEI